MRSYLAPFLLLATNVACSDALSAFGDPVTVTAQFAASGPHELLVSGPSGELIEVLTLDDLDRDVQVPPDGSLSWRSGTDVYSYANLAEGDVVAFRSPDASRVTTDVTFRAAPNLPERRMRASLGCAVVDFSTHVGATVPVDCDQRRLTIAFMELDVTDRVVGVAMVEVLGGWEGGVDVPAPEAFDAVLRPEPVEVVGLATGQSAVLSLRGARGRQQFGTLPGQVSLDGASTSTIVHTYPVAFDHFESSLVVFEDNGQLALVRPNRDAIRQVSVETALPTVANGRASPAEASWTLVGDTGEVDGLLYVLKEAVGSQGVSTWWVAKRAQAESSWVKPEVPESLAHWRAPDADVSTASVFLIDDVGATATSRLVSLVDAFEPSTLPVTTRTAFLPFDQ